MPQETRQCQNCKKEFGIEPDDFAFYEKIRVPAPTFCPECRFQRRLAWRNERTLYKRKCGLCGKDTITMYGEHTGITVYCGSCWWSDNWDPLSYGQEYDFSRPFFEQMQELLHAVPHQSLSVSYKTLVNSEYNNMNHWLKNCYLLFNSDYDEDCMYGEEAEHTKDSADITMTDKSQLLYQCLNCNNCYEVRFSADCENCRNVWFSKNMVECSDCFGCVNLKGEQYYIFNKPYSKEEYFQKLKEFNLSSYSSLERLKKEVAEFRLRFPYKYMHGTHNTNVSGDYIYHSKNTHHTYIATEAENCKYCMWLIVKTNKDSYDFTQFGENTQLVYEALVCGKGISRVMTSFSVLEGHDIAYSFNCFSNCANLFGCIGLRQKQYCILNKEYRKEEYEALLPKIIAHMSDMPFVDKKDRRYGYGDFFPIEHSPFGYNETTAYEYFPLNKEEAVEKAYRWKEEETKNYQITQNPENLPNESKDISDTILKEIIGCEHQGKCQDQCTTAFRIIPQELAFYRRMNLPLPHLCPNCRHYERVWERNPLKLWHRKCTCGGGASENGIYKNQSSHFHGSPPAGGHCPNEFETSYAPERKEIVYCEQCYQEEVV